MVAAEGQTTGAAEQWRDLPYFPENGGLHLPWFRAGELLGLEIGEEKWLVDRLIPAETINMLVGSPGTGKSLLVVDLCCCVATGTAFLGREVRPGKVMYLAAEDGWRRVSKRLRLWAEGRGVDAPSLDNFYVLPSPLQIAAGEDFADQAEAAFAAWQQLEEDIAAIDPVLVVLDPLVDIHAGMDENKSADMAGLMRVLRRLVRGQDRAMLITHHDKKGVLEPSVYSSRGSGALAGAMDGQYHLVSAQAGEGDEEDALQVILHVTKGRDLPPSLKRPVGLRFDRGHWLVDEAVKTARKMKEGGELRAVYDWLRVQGGGGASIREAQIGLGIAYNTAQARLERLHRLGAAILAVERPARYQVNPGARDLIA
jgi:hypothetical protein